jgi:lipoprotein-anchoring transpeptidase ErfK/SrfK
MRPVSTASYAKRHFHQIALLTVVGAIGAISPAEAALYYWPGQSYDPGYYDQDAPVQPRRVKPKRLAPKTEVQKSTAAKPQGPLIIAVSIHNQNVRVYDANGLFAESPVSTGMQGHSTPMGVFSVIQKQKYHESNIYSGAPMPYMQRITWSGIAMHAGALPGYPASHGCIRLPMAFATKIYGWTRMGARVIVAPGEVKPASFAHALLPTQKIAPQPMASDDSQKDTPLGAKGDKGADAAPAVKAEADIALELRTTIGHAQTTAATAVQTRTADASSAAPTMSDVAAPAPAAAAKPDDASKPEAAKTAAGDAGRQKGPCPSSRRYCRTTEAQRPDRGPDQPQGLQAVCAAELCAAVRSARYHSAERSAVGHPRVHRRDRQGRSQRAALVGDLDA